MFKFILDAISNTLGFSKVEARGTLVLIFIMLTGIAFSKFYEQTLKNPTPFNEDEAAALDQWVAEVNSSYSLKTPSKDVSGSRSLASPKTYTNPKKPASSKLYLRGVSLDAQLTLFNAQGQYLKQLSVQNYVQEVDISELQKGVYWLQISGKQGIGMRKFIKQ